MPLTDKACKAALPRSRVYRLADSGGMYLEVHPNGAKYWRLKYRLKGKEKRAAFGVYPKVSLAEARAQRDDTKKLVAAGLDPRSKETPEADFESVAREWHKINEDKWTADYAKEMITRLERDVFPEIKGKITAAGLLKIIRKIEDRGAREVARRVLQICSQVFRYGIVIEKFETNPAADLSGALKPVKHEHFAAFEASDLPDFIDKLKRNEARLFPQTIRAIWLMLYTFVRTSELIEAEKPEFREVWEIPGERMKMKKAHLVPLSRQAKAILSEQLKHSNSKYLFPHHSDPEKHMSNNTILFALYRMGYKGKMTGHGFRALALSTIKEKLGYRHEVVDRQLAHVPANKVDQAYDRAKFLDERKKMMQEWADYLDGLPRP